jgi:hypothetical protein
MRQIVIRVPADATVFLLEDSSLRLRWFCERIQRIRYSSNVEHALEILSSMPRDSFLFLDHDLCWLDAAGRKPGSGVRVAHYVAQNGFAGRIVIHSVNEQGAAEMKRWLPQAEVHPFGSFEIASLESRSTSA